MKFLLFAALAIVVRTISAQSPAAPYHVGQSAVLGGEGGWDYLSADHAGGRLYVSHGTQVEVLSLSTLRRVGTIPNTPRVHGILVVPARHRGFISCGENNTVALFDPATLQVTGTVSTGAKPDALLYDAFSDRVFVFNNGGNSTTVLAAATGAVIGTLALGGAPEAGATDEAGTIFVNLEDKSEIVAFDAKTLQVRHRWPLGPGQEPTGLGYDHPTRRLFSACGNAQVVVLDARKGQVLGTIPTGPGTDGLVVDEVRHLAFVSNGGNGTLTVFPTNFTTAPHALAMVPTARGARTLALDAVTHRLYLPTADYGPRPASTPAVPKPRPSIVPGTFRVLEVVPAE